MEAKQDNPSVRQTLSIHLLPEVFVIGNQYPILRVCLVDDILIGHTARFSVNGKHVV